MAKKRGVNSEILRKDSNGSHKVSPMWLLFIVCKVYLH